MTVTTAPRRDQGLRLLTAGAVLFVAAVAAVVSFLHIEALALAHGQPFVAAVLLPLSIDVTVVASSLVMLRAARAGIAAPRLARFMLVLAVAATLAANVGYGSAYGLVGAAISGWPAVAFIGCAEMAIGMVRKTHADAAPESSSTGAPDSPPAHLSSASSFAIPKLSDEERAFRRARIKELAKLPESIRENIRIHPESNCWEWQGTLTDDGYGRVTWDGRKRAVHRLVYEMLSGPIPTGLALDHVRTRGCISKACCWPAHLEPVTTAENNGRRSIVGFKDVEREFESDLAAGVLPSVRQVKLRMQVGHTKAKAFREHLERLAGERVAGERVAA